MSRNDKIFVLWMIMIAVSALIIYVGSRSK